MNFLKLDILFKIKSPKTRKVINILNNMIITKPIDYKENNNLMNSASSPIISFTS